MLLQVPLLTMLPVPFIRIADATIDFNVKINSVTTTSNQETNSYGTKLDVDTSFSFWRFKTSAKLNATLSNQKTSSSEEEIKRDYSLSIHIRAVQDQVPAAPSDCWIFCRMPLFRWMPTQPRKIRKNSLQASRRNRKEGP